MKRFSAAAQKAVGMGLLSCALGGRPALAAGTKADTIESRTLSVRIERPFETAYEFLADPGNWNQWAKGLGSNIRHSPDGWIADSSDGVVRVQFSDRNAFGIVDHTVVRASGTRVYVPMRLIANGGGCELMFTLFREPAISDQQYASDAGFVQRDLERLKRLLEE